MQLNDQQAASGSYKAATWADNGGAFQPNVGILGLIVTWKYFVSLNSAE